MEEVADTAEALGLPGGLGRGAADVFRRWDAHRDRPAELEELLDDLAPTSRADDVDAVDERL